MDCLHGHLDPLRMMAVKPRGGKNDCESGVKVFKERITRLFKEEKMTSMERIPTSTSRF